MEWAVGVASKKEGSQRAQSGTGARMRDALNQYSETVSKRVSLVSLSNSGSARLQGEEERATHVGLGP